MIIRFADSLGRLLSGSSSDEDAFVRFLPNVQDLLGTAWVDPSSGEMIIVDRMSNQETTQLPQRTLLTLLRKARKLADADEREPLIIYLPRMLANMFDEARLQRAIYESLNGGDTSKPNNVTIVSI